MTNTTQPVITVDALVAMGGTLWERGGQRRVYLGERLVCDLLGLRFTRYDSGNIKSATLDGDAISNRTASDMLDAARGVYYDVTLGKFMGGMGRSIRSAVEGRLAPASASVEG